MIFNVYGNKRELSYPCIIIFHTGYDIMYIVLYLVTSYVCWCYTFLYMYSFILSEDLNDDIVLRK